ncbi:hypothetical protein GP486_007916 [Trichoglossum hirsutum]|uniref:RRM domain-containing protein n=1 Tax=Trichoglossum hirsutum TaxID=265104 RepID=A0A9P8L7E4_9PEZI|nr:hypothetical protein GP486_007916 [Trichoglossum hirsutum]
MEPDSKIAALLKGFESSEDEGELQHEGFTEGQAIPGLPKEKKTRRKLGGIEQSGNDTPGVIYVGRIPHGFYEHEMRSYFSQFGEITRLRLSRNRKTGRSKHYAFIEFASSEVARIVAETMDNYLMFGHILKCKVIPQEQVHEDLWKGANRRFKWIPRNLIERKKLEAAASKESWAKKVRTEMKRRKRKAEKLKAIGYDFETPTLKWVKDIEKQETNLIAGSSEVDVCQVATSSQEREETETTTTSKEVASNATKKDEVPKTDDPRQATTSTGKVRKARESMPKTPKKKRQKAE